jgi:polysaccharide biosynthesis protein PslG
MRYFSLLLFLLLPVFTSAQEAPPDPNRFGIVEGFWFPEQTCALGVGWERIIFDWSQHQPNGADDWYTLNVDDRWLVAADACNREVVALLKHTPAWATDGTAGVGVPRGLNLPIDDPDNLWANFIRRTVDYYASRGVSHYIIWNEPDIDSTTYGYEFEGTLEDYAQLLKVAYLVAKETNPAAVIHLAGTTYWHDVNEGREPYMTRLVEYLVAQPEAAEHAYYFDVLSLHLYFKTDSVYEIVTEMREILDSNGLVDKAIWINETNAAPTVDPAWPVNRPVFNLNLQQQAHFLVQASVLSLAAGAERIAVYKLYDQALAEGGESFGILSPRDASPRPAFATWAMIAERFNDVQSATLYQSETLDLVHLVHTNGQQSIVAWTRTAEETTIEIIASSDKAYRIDYLGSKSIIRPENGVYRLTLFPALCEEGEGCFLGGETIIIVQPNAATSVRESAPNNQTNEFTLQ